jgi:hypothetical protein
MIGCFPLLTNLGSLLPYTLGTRWEEPRCLLHELNRISHHKHLSMP